MNYFVYILECADGTFYTGMTSNLNRRLGQHIRGDDKRAYTYSRRPVRLVWYERLPDREAAKQREKEVKRGNRKKKETLVSNPPDDIDKLV